MDIGQDAVDRTQHRHLHPPFPDSVGMNFHVRRMPRAIFPKRSSDFRRVLREVSSSPPAKTVGNADRVVWLTGVIQIGKTVLFALHVTSSLPFESAPKLHRIAESAVQWSGLIALNTSVSVEVLWTSHFSDGKSHASVVFE
jgi:hypothetical protein